jgi:hypothetical protein
MSKNGDKPTTPPAKPTPAKPSPSTGMDRAGRFNYWTPSPRGATKSTSTTSQNVKPPTKK